MPFSSDMKPTTWLTALRRVTIISSPISTTESASAMSSRATGSACAVTGSITSSDSATSADAGEHGQADADDGLDLRWMPSWHTMRRSAHGMSDAP